MGGHKQLLFTYLWLQDDEEAYKINDIYLWLPASEQTQTVDIHLPLTSGW